MRFESRRICLLVCILAVVFCGRARAQDQHAHMNMPMNGGWTFMQDGIVFAEFNDQGGPRGGSEFAAPTWWMGMANRDTSRGRLRLTSMFSLEPATLGESGYREIFQSGEALDGRPLIDRQHPHDFFMQLAAAWRLPIGDSTGLTLAGAPVGEPALGPVAFMHRASAIDNPTAPLSHHTFDSTHVAFGVVTAAVDHGPWTVEGSLFNGREPDDDRWDFDFGRLDSFSGRVWFEPSDEWAFQASIGRLKSPEELEPGQNVVRSTVSASWTRQRDAAISSVTAGFGRNETEPGARNAFFLEGAHHGRAYTLYGRFEALQVETALLQTDRVVEAPLAGITDTVLAFTAGAVRDVFHGRGFEGGFGADVTFYGVPQSLQPSYSASPVSFHVFFRLRPPAPMGRMWNMRMAHGL